MAKDGQLKGKEWYTVEAPEMFGGKEVGEIPASTKDAVRGRTIELGATDLHSSSRKYYFKVKMKVDEVDGKTCKLKFVGHDCSRDYITRIVRKRSKRVDEITRVKTKDGAVVRVKTICATIKPVGASTQTSIRKKIDEVMKKEASEKDLGKFVKDMFMNKVQSRVKKEVDKIYPLREIEIRKTEVVE